MTPTDIEDLATVLRYGHKGPIVEADEWRPLAKHILDLLKMQREACAKSLEDMACSCNERVRATPLVVGSDS